MTLDFLLHAGVKTMYVCVSSILICHHDAISKWFQEYQGLFFQSTIGMNNLNGGRDHIIYVLTNG